MADTLQLTKYEKGYLTAFYESEALPYHKAEWPERDDDDENSWLGIQVDKTGRMFDLCVYWVDGKAVCVVYECDPCEGDDGEFNLEGNWTTNTNAEWYLTDEDDGENDNGN